MQVNSDGKVIPCCIDFKGLNDLGNLEREDLSEIWNGTKMRDLRVKHLRERGMSLALQGLHYERIRRHRYVRRLRRRNSQTNLVNPWVRCLRQQQNLV